MRRFLVVGCGGSGGQTLAYMMDQLRSDLGVDQLPQGWQFVHVDVPTTEEDGPSGIGNVDEQHGTYFGIGPQGGSYPVLDASVTRTLASAGRLDLISTWAPREPQGVGVPISAGAGQFRAIGRMITMSRAGAIYNSLHQAWDRLSAQTVGAEFNGLIDRVPGLGSNDAAAPPVVLVVSSMAGGAGASMALDICRLLTQVHNLNAGLIGVFMVSADIFDSLPTAARRGVRANALAMLGEIVSSQAGSARQHDVETLAAFGQQNGVGASIPFARVFPVGRSMGLEGTPFGDGRPDTIYRGLGRGLAALMSSGQATHAFIAYDLGNPGTEGDRDAMGWGAPSLDWGAFGFASLSMGRDRYAEYSSQRLARSAVDRLLCGHIDSGSTMGSNDQRDKLLENQWVPSANRLGLPAVGILEDDRPQALIGWLTNVAYPMDQAALAARAVVERELVTYIPAPDSTTVAAWLDPLRTKMNGRRSVVDAAVNDVAYRWTFGWHHDFLQRYLMTVEHNLADFGLPYTLAFVNRISQHLTDQLPHITKMRWNGPTDPIAIPSEVLTLVSTIRGTIKDGQMLRERLRSGYENQVREAIWARTAELIGQIFGSMIVEVFSPLKQALLEAQTLLERAEREPVVDAGLARVATDELPAWPRDSDPLVDPRFDQAINEVLLTSSTDFKVQYSAHLQQAVFGNSPSQGLQEATKQAVTQIITGRWATTGGVLAPGGPLEQTSPWRCSIFTSEPGTGRNLTPQVARFDLHVRPAELVRRTRSFVARPGEHFQRFCSEGLRDYVRGEDAPESERPRRRQEVVTKFREALTLALPLIGVNGDLVRALYSTEVDYRYKFSDVPFGQLPIAAELVDVLRRNPMVDQKDQSTESNLTAALSTTATSRIDIFGSYQNYSPIVFDSVLRPASDQWAQTPASGRQAYWQWRRSRPLPAALPMAPIERQTLVAGWFLGQIIGHVRIPESPFETPVAVWNTETTSWVSFPHPLLTPPRDFKADYDWLPAVLESSLLAIAQAHQDPVLSSMKPYQLLRQIYDNSSQDQATGLLVKAADARAAHWLREGRTGTGVNSRVPLIDSAASISDRAELTVSWLKKIRDLAGYHYMRPGQSDAPGGGTFAVIGSRAVASITPIFRDLSEDVYNATGELVVVIERAKAVAERGGDLPTVPSGAPVDKDQFQVVIPDAGTF